MCRLSTYNSAVRSPNTDKNSEEFNDMRRRRCRYRDAKASRRNGDWGGGVLSPSWLGALGSVMSYHSRVQDGDRPQTTFWLSQNALGEKKMHRPILLLNTDSGNCRDILRYAEIVFKTFEVSISGVDLLTTLTPLEYGPVHNNSRTTCITEPKQSMREKKTAAQSWS